MPRDEVLLTLSASTSTWKASGHRDRPDSRQRADGETINGLPSTKPSASAPRFFHDGPYRAHADVEYATAGSVDWCNNRRLHGSIGMIRPVEYEQAHYAAPKPEMQPT